MDFLFTFAVKQIEITQSTPLRLRVHTRWRTEPQIDDENILRFRRSLTWVDVIYLPRKRKKSIIPWLSEECYLRISWRQFPSRIEWNDFLELLDHFSKKWELDVISARESRST